MDLRRRVGRPFIVVGLLVGGMAACASTRARVVSSPKASPELLTIAPAPTSVADDAQRQSDAATAVTQPPITATPATQGPPAISPDSTTRELATTPAPVSPNPRVTNTTTRAPVIETAPPQVPSDSVGHPAGKCRAPSAALTTPGGRHVLLRATGLTSASPVVFILHGYTGTPTGIEKFAEFTALANAHGVAVAYPQGTPVPKGGFGWDSGAGSFATSGVDDVAALSQMIDAIVATGCVDDTRMTLTGESNGAGMSLVAVCDPRLAGRFRSLVMVIPAVDDAVLAHCAAHAAPPIPLTVVAGRLDKTVPYLTGRPPLLPVEQWFAEAASMLNGCSAQPLSAEMITSHADLLKPSQCGVCSELIAIDDGVHTWPGTSKGTGGLRPGTYDLDDPLLALALGEPGCISH